MPAASALAADLRTAWVLTDGKAGDEQQCLGIVEALGLSSTIIRVKPRALFALAMPWGPVDPAERPGRTGSPITPPYPDLLVASGRRAIPYVRTVKRASEGRTFTVVLKDPRTGTSAADLIWVPEHDGLRGPNVVATLTAPHRISATRLAAARAAPDPRLAPLASPRIAVLAGGDSRHHRFREEDIGRFVGHLRALADSGASLMATLSRRTPGRLADALRALARPPRHFLWDGSGDNPYLALLACADAIVTTADSTNMVGEAVATGAPVLVFEPSGGHPKITAFLDGLRAYGAVRQLTPTLEAKRYEPLDATPLVAEAVAEALSRHRQGRAGRLESSRVPHP